VSKVARDVGKRSQTKTERDEAEAFARSHRLSIANAFERNLVRKGVVEELNNHIIAEIRVVLLLRIVSNGCASRTL
jgi:hypothetical protein